MCLRVSVWGECLRVVTPWGDGEVDVDGGVGGEEFTDRVGAENAVPSCDLHVLVHETAEPVASEWLDGRAGGRGSAAGGRVLIK